MISLPLSHSRDDESHLRDANIARCMRTTFDTSVLVAKRFDARRADEMAAVSQEQLDLIACIEAFVAPNCR